MSVLTNKGGMKKVQPHPSLSATRWTLVEMFVLVAVAAIALAFACEGATGLAVCFFAAAVCFRTSTVDFSLAGDVACGLVLIFGILAFIFAIRSVLA